MRFLLKWFGRLLLLAIVAIAGVAVFGPTEPVNTDVSFDPAAFEGDLDAYFAAAEAKFDDITPGVEKQVVWAGDVGAKTPVAVLYIHGFSATLEEIRPVPDRVADALGANLVYTRLRGHGRTGEAMAEATVEGWMQDVAEALAAAREVGEDVLVMSTSTGGALATIAAVDPELSEGIIGQVLVSPNFAVKSPAAVVLTWPGVRYWGPLVAGPTRSWEPMNERHATYNTTSYPTVATLPMAATVQHVRTLDVTQITHPALFLFSDSDQVVNHDVTREMATAWGGGSHKAHPDLGEADDPFAHVITGDILSPAQNEWAVTEIMTWIEGL